MTLVDTSAWIHHLRRTDRRLVAFLNQQRVHTCDVVIGELMLGSGLPKALVSDLLVLPRLPSPTAAETRAFIDQRRRELGGAGIGWADAQIILAAAKAGAKVHTADRAVRAVCRAVGVVLG